MTSSDDVFIPKLQSLISANVDDPDFSVDTICRDMGISRAQLHRIVKEQFDVSVTLYIRKVRMKKANYLLANTNLRISEVADRVGISNPQNFSKYFTHEFAVSPTEFRRLHQTPSPATDPSTPEPTPVATEPLLPVTVPLETAPLAETIPVSTRLWSRRYVRWAAYSFVLLGLILGLSRYMQAYVQPAIQPVDTAGTSIAVLPFVNMGPPDANQISEGLLDDIYSTLLK